MIASHDILLHDFRRVAFIYITEHICRSMMILILSFQKILIGIFIYTEVEIGNINSSVIFINDMIMGNRTEFALDVVLKKIDLFLELRFQRIEIVAVKNGKIFAPGGLQPVVEGFGVSCVRRIFQKMNLVIPACIFANSVGSIIGGSVVDAKHLIPEVHLLKKNGVERPAYGGAHVVAGNNDGQQNRSIRHVILSSGIQFITQF